MAQTSCLILRLTRVSRETSPSSALFLSLLSFTAFLSLSLSSVFLLSASLNFSIKLSFFLLPLCQTTYFFFLCYHPFSLFSLFSSFLLSSFSLLSVVGIIIQCAQHPPPLCISLPLPPPAPPSFCFFLLSLNSSPSPSFCLLFISVHFSDSFLLSSGLAKVGK